ISLPAGDTGQGLPVGLALEGQPGDDARLLGLAAKVEDYLRSR
ncbi:amidase, partial [Arthrobacter deserti]|nr:amidase [Arthrobacter deserti]